MAEQKFRPYFTESELLYIISCVKESRSPNLALIRYLETFKIKIESGVVTASLLLKPSMEESLGFGVQPPSKEELESDAKLLYHAWLSNPAGRANLSPKQLSIIQEYRYSHDLMSPTEENEYELSLMQGA